MLTIKHITPMGNEAIFEAEEVTYSSHSTPVDNRLGFEPLHATLWYRQPGTSELLELREGTAYVMNGQGSTVAKYEMGGWAHPIQGGGSDAGVQVGSQLHRTA